MIPDFLKITVPDNRTLRIEHDKLENLHDTLHYHPELELHYVIKGKGIRLIGDSIGRFSVGDLILLGADLPHCWQPENSVEPPFEGGDCEFLVLKFLPYSMGSQILDLAGGNGLSNLFDQAKNGIKFSGHAKETIVGMMLELSTAHDMDRLILFFKILKELIEANEYVFLSRSHSCYTVKNVSDRSRIDQVFNYSIANYAAKITLQQMADLCDLTVTSFCRYFKTVYGKSYYDFLTEIRINKACLLMAQSDLTIENIYEQCGCSSISNFYRHFKKVTGMTPWSYRRKFDGRVAAA